MMQISMDNSIPEIIESALLKKVADQRRLEHLWWDAQREVLAMRNKHFYTPEWVTALFFRWSMFKRKVRR